MFREACIFSGNANPILSQEIATVLRSPLSKIRVTSFSDGETSCEIQENVRGVDAFIIQPTCTPVNQNFMELLIIADALRRASARRITAVVPYYGYSRQDRKGTTRSPITAKLCADLMVCSGINRVLGVDLHAGQIQGFFNIPFNHISSMKVMLESKYLKGLLNTDTVVVSPDSGGVKRARVWASRLSASLAIIDKRRPQANVCEVMQIIGEVDGRDCIIVDDMIDTAGTLCCSAGALKRAGARSVVACATHAVLSGPAIARIVDSPLSAVVVADTIPVSMAARDSGKIQVVPIAPLVADAINQIHTNGSISSLFA